MYLGKIVQSKIRMTRNRIKGKGKRTRVGEKRTKRFFVNPKESVGRIGREGTRNERKKERGKIGRAALDLVYGVLCMSYVVDASTLWRRALSL